MKTTSNRGFSLIELLVALSILAVVAAIIVPRFMNVRQNASVAVAASNLRQIQNMARQFVALGGTITAGTGDFMALIATQPTAAGTRTVLTNAKDSTGTMNSTTIYYSGTVTPSTTASATSTAGVYYSGATLGTSGGTASYADGNGDAWSFTSDANGNLTVNVIAGSATAQGIFGAGSAATSGTLP